jgi:sigma-B regulation protein RsbU (phosphoserine phosphatase)
VSTITDILAGIELAIEELETGCCYIKEYTQCQHSLDTVKQRLRQARDTVLEHERRDNLIDGLYYKVGSKLNSTFDLQDLLGIIIDALQKLIGFDAAGIFLVNHEKAEIEAEFFRGYESASMKQIHQKIGEGILGWVITHRTSANIPDVTKDQRYIIARKETRSELAVPLISEGRVIGCLNVESDRIDAFNKDDMAILETFATQASLAVERVRLQKEIWEKKFLEEELALARKIQASLLPNQAPEIEGFELAGINLPSLAVGGDYFDYIPVPSGGVGLAIADVSGKGLGAALTMTGFRAALRSEIRHNLPPEQAMHKVNHFVYESAAPDSFVTAFYGVLSGRQFSYVNAGHNPPILMHRNGNYELLDVGGLLLGFEEEQYFQVGTIPLDSGDCILLYTDGVTEAVNPEQTEFGLERLLKVLMDTKRLSVKARIETIRKQVVNFSAGSKLADDLTIILLSCL